MVQNTKVMMSSTDFAKNVYRDGFDSWLNVKVTENSRRNKEN